MGKGNGLDTYPHTILPAVGSGPAGALARLALSRAPNATAGARRRGQGHREARPSEKLYLMLVKTS